MSTNEVSRVVPFSVQGAVTDATGFPVRGFTLVAYDQDLRTRQELGRARTGSDGEYRIEYTRDQFGRAELGNADIVLEVHTGDDGVIYTTPTRFNAPPSLTIDIVLPTRGREA